MALKSYRPITPTQRFKMTPAFDEITKSKPERSLTEPLRKSGGRNNTGRFTVRHRGGGHKRRYRLVDFKRQKFGVEATVLAVEYDPNRTARIALIQYTDGEKSYILCARRPRGRRQGDVRPERRAGNRQRASAQRHSARHEHSQHRVPSRTRRPDRPQRRPDRGAEQSRGRLRARQDALRRNPEDPRELLRHHRPGRQRRSHERDQRQGRTHPLAGSPSAPSAACS